VALPKASWLHLEKSEETAMTAVKDIKTGKWRFYGVGSRRTFARIWGITVSNPEKSKAEKLK
jgi:hypothetical protein